MSIAVDTFCSSLSIAEFNNSIRFASCARFRLMHCNWSIVCCTVRVVIGSATLVCHNNLSKTSFLVALSKASSYPSVEPKYVEAELRKFLNGELHVHRDSIKILRVQLVLEVLHLSNNLTSIRFCSFQALLYRRRSDAVD